MGARRQLHALTLHRPWTWAILHGGKRVENRSWAPPAWLRGHWFALHAGKAWDAEGALEIDRLRPGARPPAKELPPFRIVGVARLAGFVVRPEDLPGGQAVWWSGPFGWVVEEVVALPEPIAARGRQGLWRVPDAVADQVREGFRVARSPAA